MITESSIKAFLGCVVHPLALVQIHATKEQFFCVDLRICLRPRLSFNTDALPIPTSTRIAKVARQCGRNPQFWELTKESNKGWKEVNERGRGRDTRQEPRMGLHRCETGTIELRESFGTESGPLVYCRLIAIPALHGD